MLRSICTATKFLILFFAIGWIFFGCSEKKKTQGASKPEEPATATSLSRTRYTIGDSIGVGFSKKADGREIWLDGVKQTLRSNQQDSLFISTKNQKTGWHQLVIKGSADGVGKFSDTLRVELLSDLVPGELVYSVIASFPHQKTSFTEGLEFYKGELFEGTGQNGFSKLLKIDLKTGATLKEITLEHKYFGEGITIVEDKIYQLTWQSGMCFRYDMNFKLDKTFTYYTQGWGMTHRDKTLIMSDGSSKLYFYNTEMEKVSEVDVYDHTGPVRNLNELEFVDGFVYANIFESTKIVKIDPSTGKIVANMNMEGIVPAGVDVKKDVLNGIAYQPFEDALYVTGKNWPLLFKIKVKAPAGKRLTLK